MILVKQSQLTGRLNTMELDITQEQLTAWEQNPNMLIQHAFPNLSAAEREFLLTGSTNAEWNEVFGDEE